MAKGVAVQPLRTNSLFIHTQAQIIFFPCRILQKKKSTDVERNNGVTERESQLFTKEYS